MDNNKRGFLLLAAIIGLGFGVLAHIANVEAKRANATLERLPNELAAALKAQLLGG